MAVLQTYYNKTPNKVLKQFLSVCLSICCCFSPEHHLIEQQVAANPQGSLFLRYGDREEFVIRKAAMSVCGRCL